MTRSSIALVAALSFGSSVVAAQTPLLTLDSGFSADEFGSAVAAIGDVNGDGICDLAVSAPTDSSVVQDGGIVFAISGATGATLYQIVGAEQSFEGRELSRLGDVNGDGVPDFIVVRDVWSPSAPTYGAVEVRSGLDGSFLHGVVGNDTHNLYQCRAHDVGDVDGDGIPDYLVNCYGDGAQDTGLVEVLSGVDSSLITSFAGSQPFAYVGLGAAGVGDVDLDGRPDFAITQSAASGGTGGGTVVTIYSGRTFAPIFSVVGANDPGFGGGLDAAGDVDGDGYADVLIGDNHYFQAFGEVHVYSGRTHALLYSSTGLCDGAFNPPLGDGFGSEVAGLGDVNGDGVPDFGAVSWNRWYALVFSGVDGSALYELRATPFSESATPSALKIRGVPDLNGDGRAEIMLGEPNQRSNVAPPNGLGRVIVYSDGTVNGVGTALGFGDGTGATCPCGNYGASGAGCANSTGQGARLAAFGSTSVARDDVFFEASDLPPSKAVLLIAGTGQDNFGFGFHFGDGLIVPGGTITRVWMTTACVGGESWFGTGLQSKGHWNAGDKRFFQAWYRDPAGPCGSKFNFSNAIAIVFTP